MMDETELSKLVHAIAFAADKHQNQRRKGCKHRPYINHPIEVMHLLWDVGCVRDINTLTGALLHDTLEDTDTTPEELRLHFGEEVLHIVEEVTDDKTLPKQMRKQLQIEHAPHASKSAQVIKVADKCSNVYDLSHEPPNGWSMHRIVDYLDWSEKVVAGIRDVNPGLVAYFDKVVSDARAAIAAGVLQADD